MAERNALIIFVKNAELGKVKTRLAKSVGDQRALDIYDELLRHTRDVTFSIPARLYVYFSSFIPYSDPLWPSDHYVLKQQNGNDLGERMFNAFRDVFEENFDHVAIIGSDCAELTDAIIVRAFDELEASDVVIGPATDGGYYLLGMNELHPELFKNKNWSSDTVFEDTIRDMIDQNLIWQELPMLSDIDTEDDLHRMERLHKKGIIRNVF